MAAEERDAISTKRKTNKSDGPNRLVSSMQDRDPIVHLPTFEDNTVFSLLSEDGLARGRNQLEQRLIAELGAPTLLAWHSFIENSLVPLLKKHATMKRKQWQDKYLKNVIPFMGLSTPDAESLCRQWMPAIQGFLDGHYQTVVQPTPAISRSCMSSNY
ncbi:hypothetical protein BASA83_009864 [Batrachochytrium salamandrivorans]|nr:hypothetical protein BASA83_009864 [Batrachochytrium salamandrivorans]